MACTFNLVNKDKAKSISLASGQTFSASIWQPVTTVLGLLGSGSGFGLSTVGVTFNGISTW